jgi:hypothetical protein
MFIPGILPTGCPLVEGRVLVVRFLLEVPDIFIPGMLAMLCFLTGRLFLAALFFCVLDLLLLIPGMLCMS